MKKKNFGKLKKNYNLNWKYGGWRLAKKKVYTNNERGRHRVRLITENEDEAFEQFFQSPTLRLKIINDQ